MAINRGCHTPGDMRTNWCDIGRYLPHDEAVKVKKLAGSVACLIHKDALDPNTLYLKEDVDSFHLFVKKNQKKLNPDWVGPKGECNGLADHEKFRNEPACGKGTSFLVGKQLAVTAAHCILDKECEFINPVLRHLRLIFDFHMTFCEECQNSDQNKWNDDFSKSTYSFTVLAYKYTRGAEDWAILKLDKEVEGREPLKINFGHEVTSGQGAFAADDVYMLGHPFGLPLKYTRDAVVIEQSSASKYFTANLDAFRANSGSPVFLLKTHEVVGMLYMGDMEDFENKNGDGILTTYHASALDETKFKDGSWKHERCYKATALTFLQTTLTSIDIPDVPQHFNVDIKQGLNVEAKCTTQGCTKFDIMNFIPVNKKGKFNVRAVCASTNCPQCKQVIKYKDINMIVLSHCKYTIECMNLEGKYMKETLTLEGGQKYNIDIRKWKFIELNINY